MADDKDADEGIRVTDRRVSTQGSAEAAGPTEAEQNEAARRAEQVETDEADVPPIDFNTFVLSLSASAALHLGLAPDPRTGKPEVSLPLARQTIDLLALLEKKTEGNLTGEEERLLSQVLYDLRMQFVARAKQK